MAISSTTTGTDTSTLTPAWAPATDSTSRLEDSQASQSLAVTRGSSDTATDATQRSSSSNDLSEESSTAQLGSSGSASTEQDSEWVERFESWSALGDAQATVADLQSAESSLQQTYRQLQHLQQQLTQDSSDAAQLASKLQQLDAQRQQVGALTSQLEPVAMTEGGDSQSYTLEKVDLLTARPTDEQVRIYFPASRSGVSASIPAGTTGQDVADALNQSLQKEGVTVGLNDQGQLTFSAGSEDARKLSQPILMSGQGIRVPAGNAVTVRLTAEQSTLGALASQISGVTTQEDKQEVQQQIQSLLRQIQDTVQDIRTYRQELLQNAQSLATASVSGSDSAVSSALQGMQQSFGQQDYQSVATSLQAQANLSSQTVVALLS